MGRPNPPSATVTSVLSESESVVFFASSVVNEDIYRYIFLWFAMCSTVIYSSSAATAITIDPRLSVTGALVILLPSSIDYYGGILYVGDLLFIPFFWFFVIVIPQL